VTIIGGQLDGSKSSNGQYGKGIGICGCTNITIDNVSIKNISEGLNTGFLYTPNGNNNLKIYNTNLDNLLVGLAIGDGQNVTIRNCDISNITSSGIQIHPISFDVNLVGSIKNLTIENCNIIENNIYISGSHFIVENITVKDSILNNFHIVGGTNVVLDNCNLNTLIMGDNSIKVYDCNMKEFQTYSGNGYFKNCTFINDTGGSLGILSRENYYIKDTSGNITGCNPLEFLEFDNCNFKGSGYLLLSVALSGEIYDN
jgi:hypothetical protein